MTLTAEQKKKIEEEEKYRSLIHSKGINKSGRNKVTAGLFGILLGGIGIHKFYLGHAGLGIIYILFCWTFIPTIVGFIEGILYLVMSDKEFDSKYN